RPSRVLTMINAMEFEDPQLSQTLERFPRRLRQGIERGLHRATELLRAAVAARAASPLGMAAPGAFGEYAASLRSEVVDERGQPVGRVFLAPPADRYGLFVEAGTRPHFPPPGALEGWVRRRLGITGESEAREVAFRIGRKIARQGTQGHFFFERALRENEARVAAVMEEEIAKAVPGEL
ncbi:MAG TPA: hypothetical protein VNL98_04615, partial [Gemmatimonadales bacterium]|nr:hypothetical protein [Gemmatimonadales bacterium]